MSHVLRPAEGIDSHESTKSTKGTEQEEKRAVCRTQFLSTKGTKERRIGNGPRRTQGGVPSSSTLTAARERLSSACMASTSSAANPRRLENDPRFLERIAQARASLRAGQGISWQDVDTGAEPTAEALKVSDKPRTRRR